MIIDGNALAADIYQSLKEVVAIRSGAPHLTIFTCAPDKATQQYLALKKRKAAEVGIAVNVIEFPEGITTAEIEQSVQHAQMQTDGIVLQLPLPPHINTDTIVRAIPTSYDVDGMHFDGTSATMMSPVAAAIDHIAHVNDVMVATQQVVVVGNGRLVGAPATLWAQKCGGHVTVINKETDEVERSAVIAHADILILGAGRPNLVTPDMVKDGVIIFDAGTSEDGGELRGDADPACAQKASLFTPVPGGIGPLTVALLLRNLIELSGRQDA